MHLDKSDDGFESTSGIKSSLSSGSESDETLDALGKLMPCSCNAFLAGLPLRFLERLIAFSQPLSF